MPQNRFPTRDARGKHCKHLNEQWAAHERFEEELVAELNAEVRAARTLSTQQSIQSDPRHRSFHSCATQSKTDKIQEALFPL